MLDNTYYYDALSTAISNIWEKVYKNDDYAIEQLCMYNAMMSYYTNSTTDIEVRRMVLYNYLSNEFKTGTQTSTLDRYKSILPVNTMIPRALNLLSIIYDYPPQREFNETNETINTELKDLYQLADINGLMQDIYKRAIYTDIVAVRPYVYENQLRLFYLTPDNLRVETADNDSLTINKVMYSVYNAEDKHNEIHIWTDKEYTILKKKNVETIPNRYGMIPFVLLRMNNNAEIYTSGLYELLETQLNINKFEWLARMDATYNGLPIKLVSGIGVNNIEIAPDKIIEVPFTNRDEHEPSIKFIQPEPEYDNISDYAKRLENNALMSIGIPYSVLSTDNSSLLSGISRIIERSELLERRAKDINKLTKFERKLAEMITLILSIDANRGLEIENFSINYADDITYIEPKEEFELDISKFEKGFISVEDMYKKWSGATLGDKETINEIKQRIDIYKQIYGELNGRDGDVRDVATERESGTNV